MTKTFLRTVCMTVLLLALCCCVSGCFLASSINYQWINDLTNKTMQANFAVYVMRENYDIFGRVTESQQGLGSGVLFKKVTTQSSLDDSYETDYYVLTNNHTVATSASFEKSIYKVKDYKGNVFNAEVVARQAEYDLAVVKFTINEGEYSYQPLSIATKNPETSVTVAAIGHPKGQSNAITVGQVKGYGTAKSSSEEVQAVSAVEFEVIYHDAPIDVGNSGGALIAQNGEIVGINFAMTVDGEEGDSLGCAIPAEKVLEFLVSNDIAP